MKTANLALASKNKARTIIVVPDRKTCSTCKESKHSGMFFSDRRRADGLYSNCKACHTSNTTGWKKSNPRTVRAIERRSYAKHAQARRDYTRQWQDENIVRSRAASAAWKLANRERSTALEVTRQRRTRNSPGAATADQILARWAYYGDKCWMCGVPAEHTDHVKPVSKGGSNWPANLRPACAQCNLSKNDKWPFPLVA